MWAPGPEAKCNIEGEALDASQSGSCAPTTGKLANIISTHIHHCVFLGCRQLFTGRHHKDGWEEVWEGAPPGRRHVY